MERRVGTALIKVCSKESVSSLNEVISRYSDIIIARQGIPLRDKGFSLISIVFEGDNDMVGALTGQLGKLKDIEIKSVLLKSTI